MVKCFKYGEQYEDLRFAESIRSEVALKNVLPRSTLFRTAFLFYLLIAFPENGEIGVHCYQSKTKLLQLFKVFGIAKQDAALLAVFRSGGGHFFQTTRIKSSGH